VKGNKKILFTLFLAVIYSFFACSSVVIAEKTGDVIVSLQVNNPMMQVNGAEAEIDAGRGTTPVIVDGRTLVPIRAIIESFDGVVDWEDASRTVKLTVEDDVVLLVLDSNTAYLNDEVYLLDVAPTVINNRTMLPIRFVAESFHFGVAWEADRETVTIIRNTLDEDEYNHLMNVIPAYSGSPYVQINDGIPFFKEYEIIGASFEYYSNLDELGRCDVCMASVSEDIMPGEERESIGSVTPTGWMNASYETVPGKYLYNRCHLIGYQLTGENANKRNLITGTRYLNIEGMLPFENMVDSYVEETGNHVVYRATPVFRENNLVADGVLMEGYSVEDAGQGITFCVYCYNVQPTVVIDYKTGASWQENSKPALDTPEETGTQNAVYRTPAGKKYHLDADCGGKNSFRVALGQALSAGLTPCSKCAE